MSRYLVTGGAGFIGSHLVSALVQRGDRARVLDDLSGGRRANLGHLDVGELGSGAPVELLVGDVTDAGTCRRACEGVAGVFHQAAQVSVPESVEHPQGAKRFVGRLHQVFGHQFISRVEKRRLTVAHRTAIEDSMYEPEADYTKQPF